MGVLVEPALACALDMVLKCDEDAEEEAEEESKEFEFTVERTSGLYNDWNSRLAVGADKGDN